MSVSFSGHPLRGNKVMRLIYLDEAGISNPAQEPFMVVAGIAVNADRQFKAIEEHLDEVARKHLPEEMRGIAFHAMELFHGTKNFPRDKWPLVKRLEILADLARIPSKFDLPICVGATDRKWAPTALDRPISTAALEQVVHAHSFYKFVMQVEVIMRATASDEVAMLIAEDRPIVRKMLKFAHAALRGRAPSWAKTDLESAKAEDPLMRLLVPLERIVETVHFAEKTESSLLQIADVCAFICKRNLMKASHADDLYEHVKRQVVFAPEVMAALRASSETAS